MELKKNIEHFTGRFGYFIATHAWKVCILSFLFNGLLGLGMLNLPKHSLLNNNIKELYVSEETRVDSAARRLKQIFNETDKSQYPHQIIERPLFTEIIVWRSDIGNIINSSSILNEIKLTVYKIINITFQSHKGEQLNYLDICYQRKNSCYIDGGDMLIGLSLCYNQSLPVQLYQQENTFNCSEIIQDSLSNFTVENGTLVSATYIKFRFNLRQDSEELESHSKRWMDQFIFHMKEIGEELKAHGLLVAYSHSDSFLEELGNDTFIDIRYFSLVFTIYFTYIGFVMSGGNILTKRMNIGRMGIIVTPTSILGAWGLLMACNVEFTNVIGVAPLLIVCHQIVNTMKTLSYLHDVNDERDARKRVAYAVRKSVIPLTVTTLCYAVPFAVAVASKYYAIRLVGIYMVTTILFNHVNHFIFYTSCLAIHERRIDAGIHFCFCKKLQPRESLEGRNCCIICCCSGTSPETKHDVESTIEKICRKQMLRFMLTGPSKLIALAASFAFIGLAAWGLLCIQVHSFEREEVLPSSYFSLWNQMNKKFPSDTTIQIANVHPNGYIKDFGLVSEMQKDMINRFSSHAKWLLAWNDFYIQTSYANITSEVGLISTLTTKFLHKNPIFFNDIMISENNSSIKATRFYLKTNSVRSYVELLDIRNLMYDYSEDWNAQLEKHTRGMATKVEGSEKFVDVYCRDLYELYDQKEPLWELIVFAAVQFLVVLIGLLIVGNFTWVSFFLAFVFVIVIVGLIGMSYHFGIYINSVSLICFMVNGSVVVEIFIHTFDSYLHAPGKDQLDRINIVFNTDTQTLFHPIFGLFLGLLILFLVKSFVFVTYFKISLLTGIVNVMLIVCLPLLLSVTCSGSQIPATKSLTIYTIKLEKNDNTQKTGIDNSSF